MGEQLKQLVCTKEDSGGGLQSKAQDSKCKVLGETHQRDHLRRLSTCNSFVCSSDEIIKEPQNNVHSHDLKFHRDVKEKKKKIPCITTRCCSPNSPVQETPASSPLSFALRAHSGLGDLVPCARCCPCDEWERNLGPHCCPSPLVEPQQ